MTKCSPANKTHSKQVLKMASSEQSNSFHGIPLPEYDVMATIMVVDRMFW